MIRMICDACGQEVEPDVNGGCRLKIGNREFALHFCRKHKLELFTLVDKFVLGGDGTLNTFDIKRIKRVD